MSLILLRPDQLPASVTELRATPTGAGHRRLARQLAGGRASVDTLDRLRLLPHVMNGTAFAGPGRESGAADIPFVYDEHLREYDAFFDVRRADAADGVFAQSLLVAYRSLLEEGLGCGTRLSWAQWSALCTAYHTMIGFVAGAESRPGPLPVAEPPLLRWHPDPDRRWRIGHHVFFTQTQSLVVALHCFRQARADDDTDLARRMLALAGQLLTASAVAFIFAGEFSAGQYHAQVRPSMEPPSVSGGFSGLMSADHHYLVRLLAALRPDLLALPADLRGEHRRFVAALEGAYEAHKYVCARFGGDRGASLRMSTASTATAVDVIHGLKIARTKLVRSPR